MSQSAYIAQLNPMEQKVLQIAISHLETSFSLSKSIGFQEWQQAQQTQAAQPTQAQPTQAQPIQAQPIQAQPIQAAQPMQAVQQTQAQPIQAVQPPKKRIVKKTIKINSTTS
jgi:hypothetical protein